MAQPKWLGLARPKKKKERKITLGRSRPNHFWAGIGPSFSRLSSDQISGSGQPHIFCNIIIIIIIIIIFVGCKITR